MKRPAFQFYPGDWQRDVALRSCSISARGLWIEMMCVMHQADPYGHLLINGSALQSPQLARMIGCSDKEAKRWIGELEVAGVFSKTAEGVIFSRRMVKDERLREIRGAVGKMGGNPNLLKQKDNQTYNQDAKQSPTPSSSSSSSSSKKEKPSAFAPPDWIPAEPWKAWLEVRSKVKAPNTPYALQCAVKDLERLRNAGDDPAAVLDKATSRGWRGLFPLNGSGSPDYSAVIAGLKD